MITQCQTALLYAIAQHGPLTFGEAATATQSEWSDVNDALRSLQRGGFVVIFDDARVRLTAAGRKLAQETSLS